MLCHDLNTRIQTWLRNYDKIQSFAVFLIHIQIGCALIGSLGALYNGISLINLGIALFALVAIESGNQNLGRNYAVLLFSAIVLDILWFILFSHEIWHISSEIYGKFVILSVKLTLLMEIIGFSVRSSSMLLWIQIYRLGASHVDSTFSRDGDLESRNSFINPSTPPVVRRSPCSDDVLGGAIYDPPYYSSLFTDNQDEGSLHGGQNCSGMDDAAQLKPSIYNGRKPTFESLKSITSQCMILVGHEDHDPHLISGERRFVSFLHG
ncbi:uncharacterized protein LOC112521661 isoform X2 [Cynara cardunculus var. scolymus]|uniref:uncharacterized protein LOC112521661 isoform X2 n=1 Tax=Cynara cardunculus var. scolymus TaxID=59895 RepID=UPI000D6279F7|nr:uncharacterized protein LOC112521661 isoform X2 [Cynara cardunculus var. scolymus]